MSDKQIFAAIEVADREIRLIVGEFFNTRFNIIKVEKVAVDAFEQNQLQQPENITKAIQKATYQTEKVIGAPIKKVILAIPSIDVKRYSVKSTVDVEGIDCVVTVNDIRAAIKKAQMINIDPDYALIQTVCVKYTVNGISSRRIPIGEIGHTLTIDVDLLCASKSVAFDLVSCVENAGLQVMDIFLDIYGVGKEAALFEQAVDQNIIILKLERNSTTLGLLSQGKLMSCVIDANGLLNFGKNLCQKYNLKEAEVVELMKYNARLTEKVYSNNPVYIWNDQGETQKISEKQVCEEMSSAIQTWLNSIEKLCRPILQAGPTTVVITGEGGEMQDLNVLLQKRLQCEVRNYIPETLGGRNAGLTGCLGLFYAYKDKLPITGYTDNSLDMDVFMQSVAYREKEKASGQEDTLTNKLKSILFDNRK